MNYGKSVRHMGVFKCFYMTATQAELSSE